MRVVVDTNVLLDGGLDPKSSAALLATHANNNSFVICRWALDEAADVITRADAARSKKVIAIAAVEQFAASLSQLVTDDGGTHLPRNKDEMARRSVAACGADALLTRNVKDFPTIRTVTPVELLRARDFHMWTIERPWPGYRSEGTVAIAGRCWPDESFGFMVEAESGCLVGISPNDGTIRVNRPKDFGVTQAAPLPHGRDLAIFARIRDGRTVQIDFVDLDGDGPLVRAGTATRRSKAKWKPALKYGAGYEWNLECTWMGCLGRAVSDDAILQMAKHQTTEVAVSGLSVSAALARMRIVDDFRTDNMQISMVALQESPQTRHLRVRMRGGERGTR